MLLDTMALMADELDVSLLKNATDADIKTIIQTLETNGYLNFNYEVLT